MKLNIIDCTFRDGGYYCNWDFDEETIRKYLVAAATAKLDIIEIGFRRLPKKEFLGPFAYSSDEFLNSLSLPKALPLAVMVNANELISYEVGAEAAINKLFSNKNKSPIEIVRVATHVENVDDCKSIVLQLENLGYRVMLNLMQFDSISDDDITKSANIVESWDCIEVLFFADSFGNMDPGTISKKIKALSTGWSGPIGIHTHDNKGQALANCIAAMDVGVTYFDSTILGMGRGAGNVRTENLLVEMMQRSSGEYYPDALFPLVLQEFKELQTNYGWGPNLYYFLSAVHGIHPSYIQEMLGEKRCGTDQVLSAINFLKSTGAPIYDLEKMLRAISGIHGNENGEWSEDGWAKGRTVLIIGPAKSSARHIKAIRRFVERTNPIVLCLNINDSVPEDIVTAYVSCHETHILIEADHYAKLNKPLIIPMGRVPNEIKDTFKNAEIYDYGLRIQEDTFNIGKHGCTLPAPLSVAYALSFVHAAGAKNVLLAGLDGYDIADPKQKVMVEVLKLYTHLDDTLPLKAVTQTTYPIEQCSIYEPDL